LNPASGAAAGRSFADLQIEEAELGRQELAKLIGAEEAMKVAWLRRLGRRQDGTWLAAVKTVVPGEPSQKGRPWHPLGPKVIVDFHPLPEAVQLIRSGAEAGAERLERLLAENAAAVERAEQEFEAEKRRVQVEQERQARQLEHDRREFRADVWASLGPLAQMTYTLALAVQQRDPELAKDLRAVARQANENRGELHMPWPRQRWWE
jgi:hypothetical protein